MHGLEAPPDSPEPSSPIMGLLAKHETKPTPSNVYNWRVYALACVASFGSMTIGYDSGMSSRPESCPRWR